MSDREKLYNAITEIDDALINDAVTPKKYSTAKIAVIAACLCLIAAGAAMLLPQRGKAPEMQEAAIIEETPRDYSPVGLSAIDIPAQGETVTFSGGAGEMMDIALFEESMLSRCCAIVEGKVTGVSQKHYDYSYYDDKFGERELFSDHRDTVVYELEVVRVWYGEEIKENSVIYIEDENYCIEGIFAMSTGRSYVLPLYRYGNEMQVWTHEEEPIGDLTRSSEYATIYPFHPQILLTDDGGYIVTDDWTTLVSGDCREITGYDEGIFHLRYLYAEDFEKRLDEIINEQLKTA